MPVTVDQAKEVLASASEAERTSIRAHQYRTSAAHLIVWGGIWALGYSADYLEPHWNYTWLALVVAGFGASAWLGRRAQGECTHYDWRPGATALVVALFTVAVFAVLPPSSGQQIGAFIPLLVALFYVLLGIWTSTVRFVAVGLTVALLTVGGYFYLWNYFGLWMAVVGGGALVLGGLWLRAAP